MNNKTDYSDFEYPSDGSVSGVLGILTKSLSIPDFEGLRANAMRRAEKYALQNEAVKLLPDQRVRFCLKHRIDAGKAVAVRYNERTSQAHYSNLQRCGSIWLCPVCAAQISEGRRSELSQAIKHFCTVSEGSVYLLTLTNAHHHGDNLAALLSGQAKALHYLWGDRKPKEKFISLNKIGHIICTEVTHGNKNGWHPHFHILLFFAQKIDEKSLQSFIAGHWQHCCKKAGLKIPSLQHGCDLRGGAYAEQYIAKWGLENEMTKGHLKKGKDGSNTPWDLLRLSEEGCTMSGYLFQQYAKAFKGKRQLSWSRGLKLLLLVEEATDEELATDTEQNSIEVKLIALEIWRLIKRYNVRADFLKAVEMDIIDGYSRADDLVMEIARKHVEQNIDEVMKNNDVSSFGAYGALSLID